eukprot:460750-Heterocapsa_arctica.AAC.1
MTYLEAEVLPANVMDKLHTEQQNKYCLIERVCDPRSRMAEWFMGHGHHAIRLGLHHVDLSD